MMAKRPPKFDPVIYTTLKSSHLLVYAIYDLRQHDEGISSEDVVSACFTLGWKSLFERDTEQGWTLGAGLHYRIVGTLKVKVDYAYQDFGRLNNVQYLSVSVAF